MSDATHKDPKVLEEEAYVYLYHEKYHEAFGLFKKAGDLYRVIGNHKQAAICLAAAGSSWSIKSGEKTFYNAAVSYEEAAKEARSAGDYEYASMLYRYAAVNYEKDMEFYNFSECFYRSKQCRRKFITYLLINPKKIRPIAKIEEEHGIKNFIKLLFSWFALSIASLVWGYGERPWRAAYAALSVICVSAGLYTCGTLARGAVPFQPNFIEAMYFSIVTFSTVGYGDIVPVGFSKVVAAGEVLSGMLTTSIFIVSLSRKYLRI
ncbi:MAG: ion channel [Candidatus Omnitrophota bacterium]